MAVSSGQTQACLTCVAYALPSGEQISTECGEATPPHSAPFFSAEMEEGESESVRIVIWI